MLMLLSFAFAETVEAPKATAVATVPTPQEDPYLWLEDVGGEKSLDWVRAQNKRSEGELTTAAGFAPLESRLLSIMDSDAKIPYVYEMGGKYYNFWKDSTHKRGIWRRTSWSEYQKAEPKWETLIDIDALGATEKESWVWRGADCLRPSYTRCLVTLSRGGADASVVREWDMKTRSFVSDGFALTEAKQDAAWIDADTLWVSTDFGPGSMTESGYARIVKRWKRGTPLTAAEQVSEAKVTDMGASAWRDDTPGFERDWIMHWTTFYTSDLFLLVDGRPVKIDKQDDAMVSSFREWMYVELRSDWTVGGKTWKAGSLLAIRLDAFLGGDRAFDLLFEPTARTSLSSFAITRNHVVVQSLDNVRSRLEVLTPGKSGWTRSTIPGLPTLGTVSASAVNPEKNDELFITVSDYVTPTTLSWAKIGKGNPKALKSLPAFYDAAGIEITQHEVTSKDGTRVPYFMVAKKGLTLDGNNPTLLYGYGGFEVSLLPSYSGSVGAAWLEPGGVYVVANIRGGGEFGPSWHQAALKANRNKAYEDFAAVAQDLIARKVTSKERLGAQGGSNGGLLMGNMLTDYPQLFGAIVCQVPLLDMKRYNKLLAGASWVGEYGNPDIAEEWSFLQNYSPYQKLKADADYPRVLFTTSTRDDRVHPGHARKMAALMAEQGHDFVYYENIEGGHGGAADNRQAAHMWALAYSFMWKQLGTTTR